MRLIYEKKSSIFKSCCYSNQNVFLFASLMLTVATDLFQNLPEIEYDKMNKAAKKYSEFWDVIYMKQD